MERTIRRYSRDYCSSLIFDLLQEIQKGVVKVDWGRMADGKGTCEKMPTHSGEPFSKDSKENLPLSAEKVR